MILSKCGKLKTRQTCATKEGGTQNLSERTTVTVTNGLSEASKHLSEINSIIKRLSTSCGTIYDSEIRTRELLAELKTIVCEKVEEIEEIHCLERPKGSGGHSGSVVTEKCISVSPSRTRVKSADNAISTTKTYL